MVGRSNFLLNWSLFWGHVNFPGGMPSCINEPCCREECQRRNHENNFKIWNTVLITTCCNWKMPKMAILTGHESTSKKIDYGVENSGELNFMLDSNLLRGLFFFKSPLQIKLKPKIRLRTAARYQSNFFRSIFGIFVAIFLKVVLSSLSCFP